MGCVKENDLIHQYIIPEKYEKWQECRKECDSRRMKVCTSLSHSNLNLECLGGIVFICSRNRSMWMHSQYFRIGFDIQISEEFL